MMVFLSLPENHPTHNGLVQRGPINTGSFTRSFKIHVAQIFQRQRSGRNSSHFDAEIQALAVSVDLETSIPEGADAAGLSSFFNTQFKWHNSSVFQFCDCLKPVETARIEKNQKTNKTTNKSQFAPHFNQTNDCAICSRKQKTPAFAGVLLNSNWLRGLDLNQLPSGYETNENKI